VMGPPTETTSLPILTGAIELDPDEDDAVDWRDLV